MTCILDVDHPEIGSLWVMLQCADSIKSLFGSLLFDLILIQHPHLKYMMYIDGNTLRSNLFKLFKITSSEASLAIFSWDAD